MSAGPVIRRSMTVALAAALLAGVPEGAISAQPHWWDAGSALPKRTGMVTDEAGLLPPDAKLRLTAMLARFESRSRHQFVIVTVRSLSGQTIENFGVRVGRSWGIGRKGINDGILLIVAPHEGKVRIEVGYGLEKALPDELCGRIIREDILPAFRTGDLAGGIGKGATAIIGVLSR
ncbi:MAG: TPM domain-containing protein [Sphingomonas sp.]|nr:TPM domain-containing protein [Sphingomonas sp.]